MSLTKRVLIDLLDHITPDTLAAIIRDLENSEGFENGEMLTILRQQYGMVLSLA